MRLVCWFFLDFIYTRVAILAVLNYLYNHLLSIMVAGRYSSNIEYRGGVIPFAQFINLFENMIENKIYKPSSSRVARNNQTFLDIDAQAACLSGYNQKYQQISCGEFEGEFSTILFDNKVGLFFENINQTLAQFGAVPSDYYSVGLILNSGRCKLNGRDFFSHHLWYAPPGADFNTTCFSQSRFAVVNIQKKFFERCLTNNFPELNLERFSTYFRSGFRNNNPEYAHKIRWLVSQIQFLIQPFPDNPFMSKQVMAHLCTEVTETITDQIGNLMGSFLMGTRKMDSCNRFKITRRACEYINDQKGVNVTIADLCRLTGVSRRTLEYAFHTCIAKSPAAYLRSIILNEIRRALLLDANIGKPIGDIVAQWGIWHLSRFAQNYRNQFDELPSETRRSIFF